MVTDRRKGRRRSQWANLAGWCLLGGALGALGCGRNHPPREAQPAPALAESSAAAAYPRRLEHDPPGLHNVIAASAQLFSGGEPHGDAGFASLARLGVKTIVSVDGARPDVAAAQAHGLRYVHVPIGYDGVPAAAGAALARVMRDCPGPIYIHCHHGQHRGPAAAAVACVAAGGQPGAAAQALLTLAGTGKEYAGLWRDVSAFSSPATDAALPELVETAAVDSFAAAMASLDRHWDDLKLCRAAGWQSPPDHADLSPARSALLVREGLHEALRALPFEPRFDAPFREWLAAAEQRARQLEDELEQGRIDAAAETFSALERACKECHARRRN